AVDGEALVQLPTILHVGAEIMPPSCPHGIVETGDEVGRQAEGERLCGAQISAESASGGKAMGEIEANQMSLHGGRGQADQRKSAIAEIELGVKPQIIFNVVIGRPIGSAEFESMGAASPGEVVLKLIALLAGEIRKQRGPSEGRDTRRAGRAQRAQAEIYSVVVQRHGIRPI